MKRLWPVCLSICWIFGFSAVTASGIEADKPTKLRWKSFKEARYFRRMVKERTVSGEGVKQDTKHKDILILRYRDYDPEKRWQVYQFGDVVASQEVPEFDSMKFKTEISAVGNPYLFRVLSEEDKMDVVEPSTFPTSWFLRQPHWVPLLPEETELREGDHWEMKVPPVAYSLAQKEKPLKPHVLLRQRWTDTVILDGYKERDWGRTESSLYWVSCYNKIVPDIWLRSRFLGAKTRF